MTSSELKPISTALQVKVLQKAVLVCSGVAEGMSVVRKMGETMQMAGVAITVTSLTDFIVFIIGAITVRRLGLSARVCVCQL